MGGPQTSNEANAAKKSPPRPPQQARSRRTRQKLIESAVGCFERHGFEETTTAMIAAEAGVAVGTVYNYFTDKREIILELFDRNDREVADEVIAQLDPASWRGTIDPRDRTRSLIDAIFHVLNVLALCLEQSQKAVHCFTTRFGFAQGLTGR